MSDKLSLFILKDSNMSKAASRLMKLIDLAAVMVRQGDEIMLVYNEKWGAFTLPMTKLREWKDPEAKEGSDRMEDWDDAAVRAAVEWLGHTTTARPRLLLDMAEFRQSDRDAVWKRYHMQVFELTADADLEIPAGRIVEWLTPDEITDTRRRPISPTTRHVIAELRSKALL
jgi:ADP-ribose pyrophosphatase YjhB (NUDIX family)